MSWDLQHQPGEDTVQVTISGHLSDAEAKELVKGAIAEVKRDGASGVLVDCRNVERGPSLAAVYWLVHDYPNLGLPRNVRVALIQPEKQQPGEVAQFYVVASSNQSYQAELFPSREAAEAWLHSAKLAAI